MSILRIVRRLGGVSLAMVLVLSGPAHARQAPELTIESIDEDFERQMVALERQRLERLARLAASQTGEQANTTYLAYFRQAIAGNLFQEAEPLAEQLLQQRQASNDVIYLAEVVNILAEADRGAFQQSLESIVQAIQAGELAPIEGDEVERGGVLPLAARLTLLEAYYQRVVQADQFDIARQAFQKMLDNAEASPIQEYLSARLAQLGLVGQQAPAIEGNDLDGDPVRLADFEGNVVLIVFWTTWSVPNAQQAEALNAIYDQYRDQGFRVLGINLDTVEAGEQEAGTVPPNVRRFVLDYNLRWPNLVNGAGDRDHAKAYHVTEVPATYLVGRDGKIAHLDLSRTNLESVIARELGAP
ncbi:hypothetical protein BH23PLA1_BH23PLA1_42710 [soil metagenome]